MTSGGSAVLGLLPGASGLTGGGTIYETCVVRRKPAEGVESAAEAFPRGHGLCNPETGEAAEAFSKTDRGRKESAPPASGDGARMLRRTWAIVLRGPANGPPVDHRQARFAKRPGSFRGG